MTTALAVIFSTLSLPAALTAAATAGSSCAAVHNHTAYLGNDIGGDPNAGQQVAGETEGERLEACCALCNASPSCRFLSLNGHTCYLKLSDAGRSHKQGVVSAARMAPLPPAPPPYNGSLPNLVFLIVESTDGRTHHPESPAYMPNIRSLQKRGAYFRNFYTNSPVCAASRSSVWSGRHVHHIPHWNQGVKVNGAWNNAEGNEEGFAHGWGDALQTLGRERNYSTNPAWGKTDWTVGGHALWNWLQCWTMYTAFPYNLSIPDSSQPGVAGGGWSEQPHGGECRSEGNVLNTTKRTHEGDWKGVDTNTAWLRDTSALGAKANQPFYLYHGMNIIHPPYLTNQLWYDKIADDLPVPEWAPLHTVHPCAFQSSMLKGCIPDTDTAADFYSVERRRRVRRVYLAMIAEFDAMVGEYIRAVEDAGLTGRTVFFVTSDHGDMDMEQQQFYKMVPFEASTRVPLTVAGPGIVHAEYEQPLSLLDLYPTLLDYAQARVPSGHTIDGHSLVPLLSGSRGAVDTARPDYALSQGHMADNAISWYMIRRGDMKLIVYGTGKENAPQLWNITADPMERNDLAAKLPALVTELTAVLRSAIDFPAVSLDVAAYNQHMFRWYQRVHGSNWTQAVSGPGGLPGGVSGTAWAPAGVDVPVALAAIEEWLAAPPRVLPCRPFNNYSAIPPPATSYP